MWKLRFYYKSGYKRGEVSKEEIFNTKEECRKRYREVFVYSDYALNPTVWCDNGKGGFKRYVEDLSMA